jgi:hypothetical protein
MGVPFLGKACIMSQIQAEPMEGIPQNLRMGLKEAKDLLEKGGSDAAEKAREKLLEMPDAADHAIYHLLLAKAAKELNQMDTAVAHLEKSLEIKSDNMQAIMRVAEHKLKKGERADSISLLEKGLEIAKQGADVKSACRVAALLIKADAIEQAIELLNDLSERVPNDKEVSHTLALAYRQQGQDLEYEKQCLNALNKTTLASSIKQRIGLAKFYLEKSSFGKVLGIISPLETINESDLPIKKAKDIINTLLALSLCEMNSLDLAMQKMVEVKEQVGITANYVWAKIQFADGDLLGSHESANAIKIAASRKISGLEMKKVRAAEVMSSSSKEKTKQRGHKILETSAEGLQNIVLFELEDNKESIYQFLAIVHPVFVNLIPG